MPFGAITTWISQMNSPAVTAIATLIDNDIIFLVLILFFVFLEERGRKRNRLILTLGLLFLLGASVKFFFQEPRPCTMAASKIPCPDGFSFPSNHATMAFALAAALWKKPRGWFYAILAFFVGFTRIYLGVHTLGDVLGGMALGVLGYYIITLGWEKMPLPIKERFSGYLE